MLIYGTNDMYMKILKDQENLDRDIEKHKSKGKKGEKGSGENETPNKKIECKEKFKCDPAGRFLTTFDTILILVIAYSCFMSMYFTAFDYVFPDYSVFWVLEVIVFLFFTVDIICSFLRRPINDDSEEANSHFGIAKRYFKSGQAIYDLLATFPFFLIKTEDGSSFGLYFKLLRLMRISRIMNLLDMDKMNAFIDIIFKE
jgi:hypothetical protein